MMTKSTKKNQRGNVQPPSVGNGNIENQIIQYPHSDPVAKQRGVCERMLCCFKSHQTPSSVSVQVKVLTCDKLSHCLFDFDCQDLNIYERETYKMDQFVLDNLSFSQFDGHEMTTHDVVLQRKHIQVTVKDYEYRGYPNPPHPGNQLPHEFMRLMFKPSTQTLWGFNQLLLSQRRLLNNKEAGELMSEEDVDDENDVDMKKTMWLVLRKTKPTNDTLKHFFAETSSHPLRIKDIVKFGRVNFKVSALSSKLLDDDIQGTYESQRNHLHTTQVNNLNQNTYMNNDRNLVSHTSIQHTEMNLNENISISQIIGTSNLKANDGAQSKRSAKKGNDKLEIESEQIVCRICLGEEQDEDNELICPCKCAGTMKHIHIECLREWMNGKKLVYNGDRVKSFFWKALECELCKTPFETSMKNKLMQIMDYERPEEEYLIMESVKSAPAKVIHVFYLNKGSEFKIGRSVETDMKIADISVSRIHSYIRIKDRKLFVEDNGAKFGTLLKIRDPLEIVEYGNKEREQSLFQVGQSLVYFGLIQNGKQKKTKKSVKKVQSDANSNSLFQKPGYLITKGLKLIPEQYVYKDDLKTSDPLMLSQYSPSPFLIKQKPTGTQREEEEDAGRALATEYEREKSPHLREDRAPPSRNFEHDATTMNIASQIKLQQLQGGQKLAGARLVRNADGDIVGENEPFSSFRRANSDRNRSQERVEAVGGQVIEDVSVSMSEQNFSLQQVILNNQLRRSLSPRGLREIHNQFGQAQFLAKQRTVAQVQNSDDIKVINNKRTLSYDTGAFKYNSNMIVPVTKKIAPNMGTHNQERYKSERNIPRESDELGEVTSQQYEHRDNPLEESKMQQVNFNHQKRDATAMDIRAPNVAVRQREFTNANSVSQNKAAFQQFVHGDDLPPARDKNNSQLFILGELESQLKELPLDKDYDQQPVRTRNEVRVLQMNEGTTIGQQLSYNARASSQSRGLGAGAYEDTQDKMFIAREEKPSPGGAYHQENVVEDKDNHAARRINNQDGRIIIKGMTPVPNARSLLQEPYEQD